MYVFWSLRHQWCQRLTSELRGGKLLAPLCLRALRLTFDITDHVGFKKGALGYHHHPLTLKTYLYELNELFLCFCFLDDLHKCIFVPDASIFATILNTGKVRSKKSSMNAVFSVCAYLNFTVVCFFQY